MTKTSKSVAAERETTNVRALKDDELDVVSGGGMLSGAVSQVLKSIGQAAQSAARG